MNAIETERMLDAIRWANDRLQHEGIVDQAIVYSEGHVKLLSEDGTVLMSEDAEVVGAGMACVLLVRDRLGLTG